MSQFHTVLEVRDEDEFAGTWRLLSPLIYESDLLGKLVTVPQGFLTDFASVPRILGIYDLEGGKCNKAAVVHDWLYSSQCVDRATADAVLREAILVSGYSAFTAGLFYMAVHLGGASHWKQPNQPQNTQVTAAMLEAA